MQEYDILLDTQESALLLQYPLNTTLPSLKEIKTKSENMFAEAKANTSAGLVSYRSTNPSTINKYYILTIGEEIVGTPIKTIFQLRPFLPETEEILKKTDKKEVKIFSINETQEELENRAKNPNYMVEKVKKMPWKTYQISSAPEKAVQVKRQPEFSKAKYVQNKEAHVPLEKIKETIYNARVVNIRELKQIYPSALMSDITQAVSEMAIEFLSRYVLKPKYFNDLSPILINILGRMRSAQGILTLSKEELINQSEEFLYVLNQIAHKENHYYRLKGYCE